MVTEEKTPDVVVEPSIPSAADRLGAVICHTGAFIGLNIIVPFIYTLFVDVKEKPFLFKHAKQALAYQIATFILCLFIFATWLGVFAAVCWCSPASELLLIGFRAFLILLAIGFVYLTIVLAYACIACGYAIAGKEYHYPFMKDISE